VRVFSSYARRQEATIGSPQSRGIALARDREQTGSSTRRKPQAERKELSTLMAASEFQQRLMNHLNRKGMSVANLAQRTGYSPLLLENLIAGKTRQMPVDFFVRVADTLEMSTLEKDALVRSWAFGIEKRSWSLTNIA
jgi:ribosome-binding protein aMBF1 (putative translation factor)